VGSRFSFHETLFSSYAKKKSYLKGKDLEITKKACQKFKHTPVSIMNFVEGTRYKTYQNQPQKTNYKHLLNPKSGGIAFALKAMGDHITHIINVTISYPKGPNNYWAFLCGKISKVKVRIELFPVTKELLGDYLGDSQYRRHFQLWLNGLWLEKDILLEFLTISENTETSTITKD